MTPIIRRTRIGRCAGVSILCGAIVLSLGCRTAPTHPVSNASTAVPLPSPLPTKPLSSTPLPVVRSGRYMLVELTPETAQQDLLLQVVDVSIPGTMSVSVGDALRYLLLRSGYQLCDAPGEASTLYALPLPAAHLHLGPIYVRDALQTLAGSAWHLEVNDVTRQVCFTRAATAPNATQARSDGPPVSNGKTIPTRALPEQRP